jgi:hypothetical protein
MKKWLVLIAFGLILSLGSAGSVLAGEIDLLTEKLVEKDVLSPIEAQILLDETNALVAKQNAEGKNGSLPSWIQKMKFKGDLRIRYQSEEKDTIRAAGTTTTADRERARVRFRLGGEAKPADDWKVYWRLDSGGTTDPRSTNATMDNNFSAKGITLGRAYMSYTPMPEVSILAGKMDRKKAIWAPGDLLWDGDINPEGATLALNKSFGSDITAWLNSSYFILEEMSSGADPSLVAIQPGVTIDATDNIKVKGSFNYYAFNGIKGLAVSNITGGSGTNTTATTPASYKYDYDSWGLSCEVGINLQKDAEVRELINYVSLFGDYITNGDPSEENNGYMFGVKFGDKKTKKPGMWQAKALYRELEKDAWVDFLGDSDFLGGDTNAKGWELIFNYALAKNVTLGIDYYRTETAKVPAGGNKEEQDLVQIDCVLKF